MWVMYKIMIAIIQYMINADNLSEMGRIFDVRRKKIRDTFSFLALKRPSITFLVDNLSLILR